MVNHEGLWYLCLVIVTRLSMMPRRFPGTRKNSTQAGSEGICRLRRRDLFRLAAWSIFSLQPVKTLAILPASAAVTGDTARQRKPDTLTTLSTFLDTLIPADGLTPSATSAGVLTDLQAYMSRHRMYIRFIRLGCRWLDKQAPAGFDAMTEVERIKLLDRMSRARVNSLPRRFFDIMRYQAMNYYYSKPVAWKGLPVNRPPQPLGYRDFQGNSKNAR